MQGLSNWLIYLLYGCLALSQFCLAENSPFDLVSPIHVNGPLNYEHSGTAVLSRHHVKLTSDAPDQRGYIISNTVKELPDNFEFTMTFKIEGESRAIYGDGMALWFLERSRPSEGGMMGLNEYYKGVSLILDTYRNGKAGKIFPRLILAQNDGTQPYDHDNDGRDNEIDSCGLRGIHNNRRQEFSHIRVTYSKTLSKIMVDVNFRDAWETCAIGNLDMGPVSMIAVSAATGEVTENHIVKDLKLVDFGAAIPNILRDTEAIEEEKAHERKLEAKEAAGSSFVWRAIKTIFKLILGMAFLILAFVAWKKFKNYRSEREHARYKLS